MSHATVANYERGKSVPSPDVLAALAEVFGKPVAWFLGDRPALSGVQYREARSLVRVGDRRDYEAMAARWVEAYVRLEELLDAPLIPRHRVQPDWPTDRPDHLAAAVRKAIQVGPSEPISSVIQVLEDFAVRVLELPTTARIDGVAALRGDEHVVVLTPSTSHDRARMNAAHELGHVLLGDCGGEGRADAEGEKRAFDFASHFLLPAAQLTEAFKGQSMVRLVQFKERYGVSLAAMIYRAERASVLSGPMAKRLWIEFSKRGWRTREPGAVRPDRATRFEQLLDEALTSGKLTWKDIPARLGVEEDEVRERLAFALGVHGDGQPRCDDADEGTILSFPE